MVFLYLVIFHECFAKFYKFTSDNWKPNTIVNDWKERETTLKHSYPPTFLFTQGVANENATYYADTSLSYYIHVAFPPPRLSVLLQLAVFLRLSPRELSPSVERRRDRKAARPRDGHSAQPVLGKVKVYTVRLPARLGTRGRTMCGCKPLPPVLWLLVRHVCGMPTSSDLFRLIDTCREMVIFYRWCDNGNFQSRLCRLLFFFLVEGSNFVEKSIRSGIIELTKSIKLIESLIRIEAQRLVSKEGRGLSV